MKNLEFLNDHYKDSFGLLKSEEINRNKLFINLFVIIIIHFFLIVDKNSILNIVFNWANKVYGIDISNQIDIIQSAMWFALSYYSIRYYQSNIYISRQYKYIHRLEKDLTEVSEIKINRESTNYLNDYPKILDVIYTFYTWIFPLIFGIVITVKIVFEYINLCDLNFFIFINTFMFLFCFILNILYLFALHKKV